MRKLAMLAAAAVLFSAVSAQAAQVISFPSLGGGLSIGSTFTPGSGLLHKFTNVASSGVGADGPFVNISGSTLVNGSEVEETNATLYWEFEVLGPGAGQVNVDINGVYSGSATGGGVVGNVLVGRGPFDLSYVFQGQCSNGHGLCTTKGFTAVAPVTVNAISVIEIVADGAGAAFSASIDPLLSLSPDLISQGYSLQVEPDALPPSTSPGGVPEPAAWALMIAGFGMAGAGLRRRRALAA